MHGSHGMHSGGASGDDGPWSRPCRIRLGAPARNGGNGEIPTPLRDLIKDVQTPHWRLKGLGIETWYSPPPPRPIRSDVPGGAAERPMRNGRRSFRRARSIVRSERTAAFGDHSRPGKMKMVGGVEHLHGTGFEDMSSGRKAIDRRSSGQNLGVKGVIRCRRTDLGNEHLGISHRSNGI